jgi:hypothetical protein
MIYGKHDKQKRLPVKEALILLGLSNLGFGYVEKSDLGIFCRMSQMVS